MRAAEANYYRALGAGFGVEVKHIDERQGKGCFAVSAFEDRAVVFRDYSLACLQSRKQTALHEGRCAEYRRPVATCEHCHRFVGSLWLQLALLSCGEAVTLRVDAATAAGAGDALQAHLPPNANFALPAISAEEAALTTTVLTRQTPDGSLLLYCSPHCHSEAQSLELQLKTRPPAAVLQLFKQHADATGNRFFILAAIFIHAIVNRLKCYGGDLEEAAQPFEYMATRPYWETVDLPDDQDPAALRHELLSQTEESLGMLRELFADELRQFPGLEAKFFTTSAYSLLLGGLNLNTISIKVPSPLVPYFLMLDALPHEHKRDAVHTLSPFLAPLLERQGHDAHECCEGDLGKSGRSEHHEDDDDQENEGENEEEEGGDVESEDGEEEEEDDEGEEDEFEFDWTAAADGVLSLSRRCKFTSGLFPPYKGYAFFPLLSTLNHSCEPNCQVAYLEDGRALVFALRDIAAGEELSISYIYRHLPLVERQQQLRSYGFVCACPRCAAEAQEAPHEDEAVALPAAMQQQEQEEQENRAPEEGKEKSNDDGTEHPQKRRRVATTATRDHHHRHGGPVNK